MSRQFRTAVALKLGLRNIRAASVVVGAAAMTACSLNLHTDISSSASAPVPSAGGCGFGDSGCVVSPSPFTPAFGPTVTAAAPPPPISGGTLVALADGVTAAASDPDRDAVFIVNTQTASLSYNIALSAGDEPGRLVEDGAGRVHVALRSGGALVTIDPKQGAVVARRNVCPAPRGVAWDSTTDLVWVACATGELVALPAAGGAAVTRVTLERDLRDVLIDKGSLAVTTFRSAEILHLATDHTILWRETMPQEDTFQPHVLWRTVQGPGHTNVSVHQEHSKQAVVTQEGGYGGGFQPSVVGSRCTVTGPNGTPVSSVDVRGVLPVDVAVSPDGTYAVVAAAGNAFSTALPGLIAVPLGGPAVPAPVLGHPANDGGAVAILPGDIHSVTGQPVAVAFDSNGHLLAQTREPAQLVVFTMPTSISSGSSRNVTLSAVSRDDTGHDIFHASAGALVACASCHPEGGDDGHVWQLDGSPRRTPSLRGTIAGTAPYHWHGDEADLVALTSDVYVKRMSGAKLDSSQMNALTGWVETIPAPPAPSWVDAAAASRGLALFQRSDTACGTCHAGPKFTNNQTVAVGTGEPFQVPPLVGVGWRTPLMHDGCAKTISERLTVCATVGHGVTAALNAQDVSDLTAYLDTL